MHDVIVVGGSIAGCSAATLFARQGLRVALLERKSDPAAYKRHCTHYIQPSAVPSLQRLGLISFIESAGAVRNRTDIWTRWGWIRHAEGDAVGYNIRRQTLDPMIRKLAADTPGVDFMPGHAATGVLQSGGRVVGVTMQAKGEIRARLVVAADGWNSQLAETAGLHATEKANGRFACFAYYRNLPQAEPGLTRVWLLERDVAYSFPNDDGYTLLAVFPAQRKLSTWKEDVETNLKTVFESLPHAPAIREGQRVSDFLGPLKLPNQSRVAVKPGLALIGDAALASDPLWGVGCGWAFQSAEWLVDSAAAALRRGDDLGPALAAYRSRRRRELAAHAFMIADFAGGRALNPLEKLMFSAAARDRLCAAHLLAFAGRCIGVSRFLAPSAIARAARVNIGHIAHQTRLGARPRLAG